MTTTAVDGTSVRAYDNSTVAGLALLSVVVGAAVAALVFITELRLAQDAAGQYAHYAAGGNVGTRVRRAGSEIDSPGRGCLVILVVIPLCLFVLATPPLFYAVVAVAHLTGWSTRRRAWNKAYEAERTKTLDAS
jgi:hypothetical protein